MQAFINQHKINFKLYFQKLNKPFENQMQEKESLFNENESFIASCLFYKLKTLTDDLLIYDKIEVRKTRAIFHII